MRCTVVLFAGAWASVVLAATTPATAGQGTPWGVAYIAPPGWTVAAGGGRVTLQRADDDARVTLIDAGRGTSAAFALQLALPARRQNRPTLLPIAPDGGWRAIEDARYPLPSAAHRVLRARVLRGSGSWTVEVVDATAAAAEAHAADLATIEAELHPQGWIPEHLDGAPARLDAGRIAAISSFVQEGLRALHIPGAALALIDHGRIVFEGGFGVRALGLPERVNARTRFMIASNTKGLTTLLIARLVDRGVLQWDEPVTHLYPAFRVGDASLTARLRVSDLVCACTGLPRSDLQWIFNTPSDARPEDVFKELAVETPTTPFGSAYQYNNLMASAAGFITAHALHPNSPLGSAYDRAMIDEVFAPLGMQDTTFEFNRALAGDHASPHADDLTGRTVRAGYALDRAAVPDRPSGGAWSTAHDMIRYVADELTPGVALNGAHVAGATEILERRRPRVSAGEGSAYGMGLRVDHIAGVTVIHHGGSLLGYQSDWAALPEAQVGAVLMMNADAGRDLRGPFLRRLVELIYGGRSLARGRLAAAAERRHLEARALRRSLLSMRPASPPTLAPAYAEPSLGSLGVRREAGKLVFQFSTLSTPVVARREADGALAFVAADPGMSDFIFVAGGTPGQRTLTVRDGQHAYTFLERP